MPITISRATIKDSDALLKIAEIAYQKYLPLMDKKPAPMLADFEKHIAEDIVFIALTEDAFQPFRNCLEYRSAEPSISRTRGVLFNKESLQEDIEFTVIAVDKRDSAAHFIFQSSGKLEEGRDIQYSHILWRYPYRIEGEQVFEFGLKPKMVPETVRLGTFSPHLSMMLTFCFNIRFDESGEERHLYWNPYLALRIFEDTAAWQIPMPERNNDI